MLHPQTVTGVTDHKAVHGYSCNGFPCMRERVCNEFARRDQTALYSKASNVMAYVITDACVKDFLCASECATTAIHPMIDETSADTASQLYINPDECIDCGNCISLCKSNAIFQIDDLPDDKAEFAEKNAAYFH